MPSNPPSRQSKKTKRTKKKKRCGRFERLKDSLKVKDDKIAMLSMKETKLNSLPAGSI